VDGAGNATEGILPAIIPLHIAEYSRGNCIYCHLPIYHPQYLSIAKKITPYFYRHKINRYVK
jgi:hypothetical protein